jgi:polyisoprenyl-teichoic acid--peptidoglycan teichoic acid transferase
LSKARRKKIWTWFAGAVGVIFLGCAVYGVMIFKGLADTVKDIHEPILREVSDMRIEPVAFKKKDPFSVLVLGVDERENDKGRSDTMIVLVVNPEAKSTKMLSIPRDSYSEIVGKGTQDKLNHAYAFGGIEMAMNSVEKLLDIPIDYVVQVNLESFKDIVDAVGGVKVNNTQDFKAGTNSFPKGEIYLNGEDALTFVRMRYNDSRGDFGRQDRQKLVIQAIMREGVSLNSLVNYKSIFAAISGNVRTNMTFDEMSEIQSKYRDALGKVDQLYMKDGQGEMMNGIWYYMLNDTELELIRNELKEHLGL